MNVNEKSEIAVAKVYLRAVSKGLIVSKPLSDAGRYDLVIDDNGKLKRVQVKYAASGNKQSKGSVRASLEKKYHRKHGCKTILYNEQDIDLLLVYIPQTDVVCVFEPPMFKNKKNLYIRYEPAKNKQQAKCIFTDDYLW